MEPDFMAILRDIAGGAAGTVAVVAFAWRKLNEITADLKEQNRRITILMTKLGVHDDDQS